MPEPTFPLKVGPPGAEPVVAVEPTEDKSAVRITFTREGIVFSAELEQSIVGRFLSAVHLAAREIGPSMEG